MNVMLREAPVQHHQRARRDLGAICLKSVVSITPPYSYDNDEIGNALGLKALSRVCRKIGIESRRTFLPLDIRTGHVVGASSNTELEIAERVANEAIAQAGVARADITVLYLVSCTIQHGRRMHFELSSTDLVRRLKLESTVSHFEMDAGCDGFVRALHNIRHLFRLGRDEHALVVVTTMPSLHFDRERCVSLPNVAQFANYVFGDGAAAAVVSNARYETGIGVIRSSWSECDASVQLGWTQFSEAAQGPEIAYAIDYETVASSYVTAIIKAVRSLQELHPFGDFKDLHRVYFHQANGVLPFKAAQELGIPSERLARIARECANTASASIPTMIAHDITSAQLTKGNVSLLGAVGAGLSCSAAVLES